MGAVEDAVDAAANFIGPFVDKDRRQDQNSPDEEPHLEPETLVMQALHHLQAVDAADKAADPDAPYDASLAGVVYGLLDLITSVGILPHLSCGVVFSQRPRSILVSVISIPSSQNETLLSHVVDILVPILDQSGLGVQPLVSQRVLPDIITALAELSFSPEVSGTAQTTYRPTYERIFSTAATSRLLPILTTLLQQDLPTWLKPQLSHELAMVPLRPHGVRHTIEFLSLSYMSKNSQVPQDASGPQSQLPIPLEAIAQASRLLVSPPSGTDQDEWIRQLAPQLLILLDGLEGKELSRAAGHIIAAGILCKKTTGAPGAIGWNLFALPLFQSIYPKSPSNVTSRKSTSDQIFTQEKALYVALQRLFTIVSSYSHAGLAKRLIGPLLLPLWSLLCYSIERPSLNEEWREIPKATISLYLKVACDPKQVDTIAANLFWDGDRTWALGPGAQGGVEIRRRQGDIENVGVSGVLARIASLNERVNLLVTLLADASIPDDIAGAVFLQTTRRWLSPGQNIKTPLVDDPDIDPLVGLVDAKLSETMATKLKDKFARSPQHIIELMVQILQNFIKERQLVMQKNSKSSIPSRATLGDIVNPQTGNKSASGEGESEELASFALSILHTLIASEDFKQTPETTKIISSILPSLEYLSQAGQSTFLPPPIINAAANLLQLLSPATTTESNSDSLAHHRADLKSAITDLTSPEPPNRTWALHAIRNLVQDPSAFPIIDIPSMTHMLLSASIADPESYVHTAAMPVLVDLASRSPNPTIRIIIDAFVDIDERSLKLRKEKDIREALDFRLRVGEVLNKLVLDENFWSIGTPTGTKHTYVKMIVEATLSLASRRGQRKKTLHARTLLAEEERKVQEEGEAAWGGPIPNLLDPKSENPADQAERDALLKIIQGWEDTGIEEDVRIRASALSVLGSIIELRLPLLNQVTVDAGLQMALLILTMETGEPKGMLRRAAALVIMGLLRAMDKALEEGTDIAVGLGIQQNEEVERVMNWVRDEDVDWLVRGHAQDVVEGLETLSMKKLYRIRDEGLRLGPDLGLEGNLRGLNVNPDLSPGNGGKRKLIVEEIE